MVAPRSSTFIKPHKTSEPGGARTHDLRIKSPLLYQLSYRPKFSFAEYCQAG